MKKWCIYLSCILLGILFISCAPKPQDAGTKQDVTKQPENTPTPEITPEEVSRPTQVDAIFLNKLPSFWSEGAEYSDYIEYNPGKLGVEMTYSGNYSRIDCLYYTEEYDDEQLFAFVVRLGNYAYGTPPDYPSKYKGGTPEDYVDRLLEYKNKKC